MKIFGITTENPLSQKIIGYMGADDIVTYEDIDAEVYVRFDDCYMMHMGSDHNFCPYMEMVGRIEGVNADGLDLPYGVDSIDFGKHMPNVIYRYYFNHDELVDLIKNRGYWGKNSKRFSLPDTFTKEQFELPIKATITIVPPDEKLPKDENNVPLFIVGFKDTSLIEIDGKSSGYDDLVRYFAVVEEEKDASAVIEDGILSHDRHNDSLLFGQEAPIVDFLDEDKDEQVREESSGENVMEEPDVDVSEFDLTEELAPPGPTEEEIEDDMYAKLQEIRSEEPVEPDEDDEKETPVEPHRTVIPKEELKRMGDEFYGLSSGKTENVDEYI